MLVITENITNRTIAYAENDNEFTNSLFEPVNITDAENNKGTLALFHKVEKKRGGVLYWTTENKGYFENKSGLFGQFGKVDGGKLYFQPTLAQIKRI